MLFRSTGRPWQLVGQSSHTAPTSLFPPSGVHQAPAPPPITSTTPVPTPLLLPRRSASFRTSGAGTSRGQPLSSKAGIKRCGSCKPQPQCWNGGYVVLRREDEMLEPALAGATISGLFWYNRSFVLLELATFFARICNLRCFLLELPLIFATTVYDFCCHWPFRFLLPPVCDFAAETQFQFFATTVCVFCCHRL